MKILEIDNLQIKYGVFGETLLSTVFNIGLYDVISTAVMAIIGAVVSFFVSYFLRRLFGNKKLL